MVRKYNRYEEYKDSGVEWIGEIPEEWEISKYKFVAEMLNGYAFSSDDYTEKGVPVLRIGDIENNKDTNSFKKIPKEIAKELKDYEIEKRDILLALTGATIGKTSIFKSDDKVLLNQRVGILRSNQNLFQNYLKYIIESNIFQTNINYLAYGGAQENIGKNDIYNMFITKPLKKEQQKIASFLDKKTAEIDKIINKKEKLIDYLKKYKKSVITEAVTTGKLGDKYINENGELVDEIVMKDSGVEWIGEIPEYWELTKGKYIFNILGSNVESKYISNKGYNYYKVDDMNTVKEDGFELGESKNKINVRKSELFEPPIILIPKRGMAILTNKVRITYKECLLDPNIMGLQPLSNNIKYLSYALFARKLYSIVDKTTIPQLNNKHIKELNIPKMNKKIQLKIVNYLEQKTFEIKNLIQTTKHSIEKYKEYKKSLIFEAVTGKIDLRDYELEGGEELAEHNYSSETERERLSAVD